MATRIDARLSVREFKTHLLYVPELLAWAKSKRLHLRTTPPLDEFEFIHIETLLCDIERHAASLTHDEAQIIVANDLELQTRMSMCFEQDGIDNSLKTELPAWLVQADAHSTWRKTLAAAIKAGELVQLHHGSLQPIDTAPQATPASGPVMPIVLDMKAPENNPSATVLRAPIADDIQAHLHKTFNELPIAIAKRIDIAFKSVIFDSQLDTLNTEERLARDAARGYSEIALRWDKATAEQRNYDAIAADIELGLLTKYVEQEKRMAIPQSIVDWWDKSMSASVWWKNESITSIHAALILCKQDPNKNRGREAEMIAAAEGTTSGGIGPDDFQALRNTFAGASGEKRRTLKDWMEYAQERDLKIHSWLGKWIVASGVIRAAQLSTPPEAPAREPVTHDTAPTMKTFKWACIKFIFPDLPRLGLWALACYMSGQNAVDNIPNNETLVKIQQLIKVICEGKLWVDFKPGADLAIVAGIIPPTIEDLPPNVDWLDIKSNLQKFSIRREDWETFSAQMIAALPPVSASGPVTPALPTLPLAELASEKMPLTASALGRIDEAVTPVIRLKKSALIQKYQATWPTVRADLDNNSRNELNIAMLGRGFYNELSAIKWAEEKGKFKVEISSLPTRNSILDSPISAKKTIK